VPNAQIVGVADDDKVGLARRGKRLKVEAAFPDYREMLEKTKPDIVSICPRWIDKHHELVLAVAERGIHIYMEKPFCRTMEEADAMVAACERTHVKLAIAHQTRYSPKAKAVKQLIEAGKIGKVLDMRPRQRRPARRRRRYLGAGHARLRPDSLLRRASPMVPSDGHTGWAAHRQKDIADGPEGLGRWPATRLAGYVRHGRWLPGVLRLDAEHAGQSQPLRVANLRLARRDRNPHRPPAGVQNPSRSELVAGRSGAAWQNITSAGIGNDEPLKDGGLHGGNLLAVERPDRAIEEERQPLAALRSPRGRGDDPCCFRSPALGRT